MMISKLWWRKRNNQKEYKRVLETSEKDEDKDFACLSLIYRLNIESFTEEKFVEIKHLTREKNSNIFEVC